MLDVIMRSSTRMFVPRAVGGVGSCWRGCGKGRCPLRMGVYGLGGRRSRNFARGNRRIRGVLQPSMTTASIGGLFLIPFVAKGTGVTHARGPVPPVLGISCCFSFRI